jgi:hypothetical protein
MLDARHDAIVVRELGDDPPWAVSVCVARGKSKEQLGARIAKRSGEHRSDFLWFSPSLTNVVDERANASQPFVTEPVKSPVHDSLSTTPQRPEGTRDHERGEGRPPVRASADNDTREQ